MPRPNLIEDGVCPFCDTQMPIEVVRAGIAGDRTRVDCPVCGLYLITGSAIDSIPRWNLTDERRHSLAFAVRRMTNRSNPPLFSTDLVRSTLDTSVIPRPDELLDESILWFGEHSSHPGQTFDLRPTTHQSIPGTWTEESFVFAANWMQSSGFFGGGISGQGQHLIMTGCYLKPAGWQRYRDLTAKRAAMRYGFMAMQFNDGQLDGVVRDHFGPEIAKTGFTLRRLDDGQGAGLIDDWQQRCLLGSRLR